MSQRLGELTEVKEEEDDLTLMVLVREVFDQGFQSELGEWT